jgi:tetratricopeptide (TPR) repeat protein
VRALADRLNVGALTLSSNGALARAARRAGVSAPVANEADALLAELDRAAFGGAPAGVKDAAKRAWRIYRDIDREARSRDSLRVAVTGSLIGVMLLVLAQGALAVQDAELDPARRFAAGITAYRSARYSDAAREFGAAANAEPRAPDAWMNYGSASWQAADTARAVVGWQRALRLEPLAADAREALIRVDLPVDESLGDVPPLPVETLALIAASLWCLAWLIAAFRMRRPGSTAMALGGISLSLALAAVAFTAHSVVAGRGLAVIDATGALRALPALAAEYGAVARVGEVVRIDERRGDWTRVALAGAREGWVEHALLVPLTRD